MYTAGWVPVSDGEGQFEDTQPSDRIAAINTERGREREQMEAHAWSPRAGEGDSTCVLALTEAGTLRPGTEGSNIDISSVDFYGLYVKK